MVPLFDTKMAGDIFLSLGRKIDIPGFEEERRFEDYLRDSWRRAFGPFHTDQEFELFWEESLRRGGHWDEKGDRPGTPALKTGVFSLDWSASRSDEGGPLLTVPFPTLALYDGRVADRPWLRELPDPVSQMAWDPWIEVHPETAKVLGIENDETIELSGGGNAESAVVTVADDIVRGIIAVPLGDHGTAGKSTPFIFPGQETEALSGGLVWVSSGVRVAGSGRIERIPRVQASFIDNGRGVVGYTTVEAMNADRDEKTGESGKKGVDKEDHQMYADHEHSGHRWGMAIDLSRCTGCSACVVACYAENNIPVAGRDGVLAGREMAWIRVERYNVTVGGSKRVIYLPMMCQHCDSAPCEPVCPVFATYHNPEGLNAQVYNRCIGTRYCSNNCPYKVRRFNWFSYSWREPLNIQLNPDVTVREKGVMEKCTFCVQRIRYARDKARDERRSIADGEIIPACAQTCPTGAIVFGDLNDPESLVSRISGKDTGYKVLEQLNTKPAVTYLKRVFREDWKT
jgi:molybdopterin-containing oxidoreductase family iron-sulfur binding subunit